MTATAERSLINAMAARLQDEETAEEMTTTVVERILVEIPGYQGLDFEDVAPLVKRQITLLLSGMFSEEMPAPPSHRETWERGGEERAGQGVPLEDMLHGWRVGLDVIRQRIHRISEEVDAPPTVLLEMLETALNWTDAGMLSGAAGHREAELEATRQQRDYRVNFLRRVLAGGMSAEDLRSATAYSINRTGEFHAIRARPRDKSEAVKIQRQLQPGHSADQRDGLIAMIDGDICGFVAMLPLKCDATVGVSEATTLAEMSRGFRLATRALEVGLALDRKGLVRFDELGVLPAVQADDEVSAVLGSQLVEPLAELGQSGDAILETVELFIRNGLRHEMTAKELFVHVNTVRYRINRFEELTGKSLREGETIVNAWWSIAHRRLADEPGERRAI